MNTTSPLNLGMIAGFARLDGDTLLVYQSHYEQLGFRLRLGPTARQPVFDYEPVAVAFRLLGGKDGAPTFEAIEVTRMARSMFPMNDTGGWRREKTFAEQAPELEAVAPRLPFCPYGTEHDLYEPKPEVLAALAEDAAWSNDLRKAIEDDELLTNVFAPRVGRRFPGAWIGVGLILSGRFERGRNRRGDQTYNFVWARFTPGPEPRPENAVEIVIASAVPGFARLRQVTLDRQPLPVLLTARIHYSPHKVPDNQLARLAINATEMLIPTPEDWGVSPSEGRRDVRAG